MLCKTLAWFNDTQNKIERRKRIKMCIPEWTGKIEEEPGHYRQDIDDNFVLEYSDKEDKKKNDKKNSKKSC